MQTLKEGDKFERYQILRAVGNGIAGVSYEAEDTRQNRRVILKLLHTKGLLPDAARRQFFREIQTISSIKHPQIAAILNYGEWHQQLFVTRTFTPHGSLLNNQSSVSLHPPLDINLAITYAIQIAKVLNYIHKAGYAHGSLTFANILVAQRPAEHQKTLPFLISDVGLTVFVQSQGYLSTSQLPITTAPEQLKGQTLPASDQYALATILYTLLAGRPPFFGSFEELERLKNQETIQSIAPLNPQVSKELENVLRRALSAHPKNRYATIHEFIHAVAKAPKKQMHSSPPEQVPEEKPQPQPESLPVAESQFEPEPLLAAEQQPESDTLPDTEEQSQPETLPDTEIQSSSESLPAAEPLPDLSATKDIEPGINARLVIMLQESTETLIYQITLDETSIGRAGSSDVLLEKDDNVSRHHALIRKENNQYVIYDSRSTEGVSVNGQKIPVEIAHILTNSDQISIGKYTLLFYDTLEVNSEAEQQAHLALGS